MRLFHAVESRAPRRRGLLAACWAIAIAATLFLVARYPALPDCLPVYRSLLGATTRAMLRDPIVVLRIPAMGLIVLLAVSLLAWHARRRAVDDWARLWRGVALADAAKTTLETLQSASASFDGGVALQRCLFAATWLVVLLFLVWLLARARRLRLADAPSTDGAVAVVLAAALLVYVVLALWPRAHRADTCSPDATSSAPRTAGSSRWS